MESLTKENFWNDLMAKYPGEVNPFCHWIDEYKKKVKWVDLFDTVKCAGDHPNHCELSVPKYHDLPIAMQFGIFLQYVAEYNGTEGGIEVVLEGGDWNKVPGIISDWFRMEHCESIRKHG